VDEFAYVAQDAHGTSSPGLVEIVIGPQPPIARVDAYTGLENLPLTVSAAQGVLANDNDNQGLPLTAQLAQGPARGTVSLNPDGSFTYTPAQGFKGDDQFTYRAVDANSNSGIPTPVALYVYYAPPVAVADQYWIVGNKPFSVVAPGVLANDIDAEHQPMTATLYHKPVYGQVTIHSDGSFVYTPPTNFVGLDDFSYQVHDPGADGGFGTVSMFVGPKAPTPAFTWTMPMNFGQDNLTSHYDRIYGNTWLTPGSDAMIDYPWEDPNYAQAYVNPTKWAVNFDASTSIAGTAPIVSYSWQAPDALGPIVQSGPTVTFHFPAQDAYDLPSHTQPAVTLIVTDANGATQKVTENIPLRDYFIASLGDSYGSGEGAPDKPAQYDLTGTRTSGPVWEDQRAHRSEYAPAAQAALQIQDAQHSVTFVSLAASGAGLQQGILGPYKGQEAALDHSLINPQIEDLATLANDRPIDTLILSAGGNDCGFDQLVTRLVKSLNKNYPAGMSAANDFLSAVAGLPDLYRSLADILNNGMTPGGQKIKVRSVYLTEYPDPTLDASGGHNPRDFPLAGTGDLLGLLSSEQLDWVSQVAVPALDNELQTIAALFHWGYIGGISDRFRSHGLLVQDPNQRWVNTGQDSVFLQGNVGLDGTYSTLPFNKPIWIGFQEELAASMALATSEAVFLVLNPLFVPPILANPNLYTMKATKGLVHPNQAGYQLGFTPQVVAELTTVGTIAGQVFQDANANGELDKGEEKHGLAGVTVQVDTSQNGTLRASGLSAVTDAGGHYFIPDVPFGDYVLQISGQQPGFYPSIAALTRHVGPSIDGTAVANFGVYTAGSISGQVFDDLNGDGMAAAGEAGLASRLVYIDENKNGSLDTLQTTSASTDTPRPIVAARYHPSPGSGHTGNGDPGNDNSDLTPGVTQSVIAVSGLSGALSAGTVTLNVTSSSTSLTASLITPWGATISLPSPIQGTVSLDLSAYRDVDANGNWTLMINDPSVVGGKLNSWSLTLTTGDAVTSTDANGNYVLPNLRPTAAGSPYVVSEIPSAGWTITAPTSGSFSVALDNGANLTGYLFGNIQPPTTRKPRAPTVSIGAFHVNENSVLTVPAGGGVLLNTTDPNNQPMTAVLVTGPAHGKLSLKPNGAFTYTPNRGFFGQDSFTYEAKDPFFTSAAATLTIAVIHLPPVAKPDTYTVAANGVLTVTAAKGVLANDTDPEKNAMRAMLVQKPADGTVVLHADGSFSYKPNPGFTGQIDTFSYQAQDVGGAGNTVTVTIAVGKQPPVASDFGEQVIENHALTVSAKKGVLVHQSRGVTAVLDLNAANGTVTLNADGSYTYTPNAGFIGIDTFTYQARSAGGLSNVATVTLNVIDPPPAAKPDSYRVFVNGALTIGATAGVLANDTDPQNAALSATLVSGPAHGSLTLNADGSFTYTPNAGFFGPDSFSYSAQRPGAMSSPATVTINVVNQLPVVQAVSYQVNENASLKISAPGILANAVDPQGYLMWAVVVRKPAHGRLVLSPDGQLVYTPAKGFSGKDTFTYQVHDAYGVSAVATATITVVPPPRHQGVALATAEEP
jgi:hypothetical protein